MKAEKNRNKQCKKFELNMQLVNLGISDKGSDVKAEKNLCEL